MPDTSSACTCCDSNCPEAVSTVNLISTEIDADNALSLSVDNSGGATTTKNISLQVIDCFLA